MWCLEVCGALYLTAYVEKNAAVCHVSLHHHHHHLPWIDANVFFNKLSASMLISWFMCVLKLNSTLVLPKQDFTSESFSPQA
jgi:hypothetical protein